MGESLISNSNLQTATELKWYLLITKVKIVDVYPITNTNQPKSVSCHVIPRSLNFSECLHFEISSDLLLRQDEGSLRRINSFSDKQRSHILEPHLYSRGLTVSVFPI